MSDSVSSSPSYNKPLTCCCNRIEEVQCDITYVEADPDAPGYGRYASQTITLTKQEECGCAGCNWYSAEIGIGVWINKPGCEPWWIIVTRTLSIELSCLGNYDGSFWSFGWATPGDYMGNRYGTFGYPECDTNSLGPVTDGPLTMFFYW